MVTKISVFVCVCVRMCMLLSDFLRGDCKQLYFSTYPPPDPGFPLPPKRPYSTNRLYFRLVCLPLQHCSHLPSQTAAPPCPTPGDGAGGEGYPGLCPPRLGGGGRRCEGLQSPGDAHCWPLVGSILSSGGRMPPLRHPGRGPLQSGQAAACVVQVGGRASVVYITPEGLPGRFVTNIKIHTH